MGDMRETVERIARSLVAILDVETKRVRRKAEAAEIAVEDAETLAHLSAATQRALTWVAEERAGEQG